MRKEIRFAIILLFFINSSYSSSKTFMSEIITSNNDTLNVYFVVKTNPFYKKILYYNSFAKKIEYFDSSKKLIKINAKDVKKLTFLDLDNKKRIFVNDGKILKEVIYENILKFYIKYHLNYRDGTDILETEVYNEEGQRIYTPPFHTSNYTLKKVAKEKPELVELIENSKLSLFELANLVMKRYEDEHLKLNK